MYSTGDGQPGVAPVQRATRTRIQGSVAAQQPPRSIAGLHAHLLAPPQQQTPILQSSQARHASSVQRPASSRGRQTASCMCGRAAGPLCDCAAQSRRKRGRANGGTAGTARHGPRGGPPTLRPALGSRVARLDAGSQAI